MGKISLNNIAEELAAKSGITREAADSFMHAFIATIEKGLHEDNIVKIKGLGTFKLMAVSDRSSVDVNTGERITIKGYTKVSFTPDSAMKEFVNRPFAHFEPTELNDGYPTEEESDALDSASSDENDDIEIAESTMVEAESATAIEEVVEETEPVVIAPEPVADVVEVETESKVEAKSESVGESVEEPATAVVETEFLVAPVEEIVEDVVEEAVEEPEPLAPSITEEEQEEAGDESVEAKEMASEEVTPLEEKEEEVVPEEIVSKEEVAAKESAPEEAAEEVAPATESAPKSKKERKERGGCGCVWMLLLIALILSGAIGWLIPMLVSEDSYEEEIEELSDMKVKPNLEEELGAEWGDEPEVKTELSVKKEDEAPKQAEPIVVSEVKDDKAEQKTSETVASESSKSQNEKTTPVAPGAKFCAVTISESLEAKTIKDITPADTTEYVMEGTLVTHELKRGETIILLAKKYYGDKRLWPYIVKYNWMKDYNNVAIGQMINVPILKEKP